MWSSWYADGSDRLMPPVKLRSTGYADTPMRRASAMNNVALSLQSPYFVSHTDIGVRGWYPPMPSASETYRKSWATHRCTARSESSRVCAPITTVESCWLSAGVSLYRCFDSAAYQLAMPPQVIGAATETCG